MSTRVDTLISKLKQLFQKQNERVQAQQKIETLEELIEDVRDIDGIVTELVKVQKENPYPNEELLSPQSHESADTLINNFVAFMEKEAPGCGINDTVGFQNFTEGNGVVALRDIAPNEVILQIPRKVMLSLDTAERAPFGELVKYCPLLTRLQSLLLVMHLLYERLDPSSYWKPYLDVLPSYVGLPIFASLPDLMALRGSACFRKALKQYQGTVQQYVLMLDLVSHHAPAKGRLQRFSFDAFRWATASVMARQNPIPAEAHASLPGAGSLAARMTLAMIPAFDMLNHRQLDGAISTNFDVGLDASVTEAPVAVARGEQVYVYYGQRPNSMLFMYQGFVASDNAFDDMVIPLPPLAPEDPFLKVKRMLLSKLGLPHADCRIPLARALTAELAELQPVPPAHVPLRTWRDAWRATWVRCMGKQELNAALTGTTKAFKEHGPSVAAARASGEPLFQDDCEGDMRARVVAAFREHLEQLIAAYPQPGAAGLPEPLSERSREFRATAARLCEVEVGLLRRELAALDE